MKLGLGSDGVTRGAEGSLFEEESVLDDIAAKMGVTGASMDFLLNGTISNGVGTRLETSAVALQEFVDGRGAAGVSRILDLQTSSVRDLRFRIGRDGAIGLIIGLCIFVSGTARTPPEAGGQESTEGRGGRARASG